MCGHQSFCPVTIKLTSRRNHHHLKTPATCANVALHNLYPGEIDLVVCTCLPFLSYLIVNPIQISGPNFGRNTSGWLLQSYQQEAVSSWFTAAFSLSSGTIGAAMSAALSRTRAIAISYGSVLHPTPLKLHEPAHNL